MVGAEILFRSSTKALSADDGMGFSWPDLVATLAVRSAQSKALRVLLWRSRNPAEDLYCTCQDPSLTHAAIR